MAAANRPALALAHPANVDNTQPEHPLILPADEPLVVNTPFLQWQPHPVAAAGAPPRMSIPHSRAAKSFLRRCSLSANPADAPVLATVNCFTFFLNAAAWTRILNELIGANLLNSAPFLAWPSFLQSIEALQLNNPGALEILAADLDLGETFDIPAIPAQPAVPAQPARRGQRAQPAIPATPAQPAVPGPAPLNFLSLYTVDMAMLAASASPMSMWADLLGALSPGRTRASRNAPLSMLATSAVMISRAVSLKLLGDAGGAAPDALVAVNLTDMLTEMRLPRCLAPLVLNDAEIRAELRDSLRSARSDNERIAVEVSRIQYTALRYLACTAWPNADPSTALLIAHGVTPL